MASVVPLLQTIMVGGPLGGGQITNVMQNRDFASRTTKIAGKATIRYRLRRIDSICPQWVDLARDEANAKSRCERLNQSQGLKPMKVYLFCVVLLTLFAAACQQPPNNPLRDVAAHCAVPLSSIYLVRSGDSAIVRENVAGEPWSAEGRACIRQWAATQGYTYVDAVPNGTTNFGR